MHSDQVQFCGVAPMVIYLAERDEVVTIAGLGGWPKATRVEALTMRFGDVAAAAIRYARDGTP